ncbi:Zn-dependent hydrolase [Jatrophihabitans lederbergiae]|uniref:Zn-dependent hydrolase n=1 Tax=Jatrophihabitans lederbergiae TaxID=3075547 RepID=A0ABU2JF07_9ACTN|nr:Zn-dependent hydrolase [Jatrophihabitans sp. DSM 44399]MDT0263331.1 Zn-dependent hydrolase [Jatrophihabitans sp. DSM 44399]
MSMLDSWVDEVGLIGGNGSAVNRFAWTPELLAACEWLVERLRELGLNAEIDAAGNVIGRWDVDGADAGTAVLIGSHLDTVPDGGRFDGALGVLSGLEAIRRLKAEGFGPCRPLWIAAFNDEEGARFGTSMFGSTAFVGDDLTALRDRVGVDGVPLAEAMRQRGFDFDEVPRAKGIDGVGCYLELHIEQGPRMEAQSLDTAVVTAIVGIGGYRVTLRGQTNHAGTTPMGERRDALTGASRVVLALRDAALASGDVTANVGRIEVRPGGTNVIPGEAVFFVDIRTANPNIFPTLGNLVRDTVRTAATAEGLTAEIAVTYEHQPVPMDSELQELLGREMEAQGLAWASLSSGAGHDAQVLAPHVPTGMLFVPSQAGISHAPEEFTPPGQREPGVSVLTSVLKTLLLSENAAVGAIAC